MEINPEQIARIFVNELKKSEEIKFGYALGTGGEIGTWARYLFDSHILRTSPDLQRSFVLAAAPGVILGTTFAVHCLNTGIELIRQNR